MAVVEYARNMAGLKGAHSSELDENTEYPVIDLMPEQKEISNMGGTMRLGAYPCKIQDESVYAKEAYGGAELISERHRHRYEMNNDYRDKLKNAGLTIAGTSPDGRLVEIEENREQIATAGIRKMKLEAGKEQYSIALLTGKRVLERTGTEPEVEKLMQEYELRIQEQESGVQNGQSREEQKKEEQKQEGEINEQNVDK